VWHTHLHGRWPSSSPLLSLTCLREDRLRSTVFVLLFLCFKTNTLLQPKRFIHSFIGTLLEALSSMNQRSAALRKSRWALTSPRCLGNSLMPCSSMSCPAFMFPRVR